MNEKERIGLLGELLVQYRLAEFGLKSYLTLQPEHDLIVEAPSSMKTIQVKTRSGVSDANGNITFKVKRESSRHHGRGNYIDYTCDIFAFVYLPTQAVIFVENSNEICGGFHVNNFTSEVSIMSAKACHLTSGCLHARATRDTSLDTIQSRFNFFEV